MKKKSRITNQEEVIAAQVNVKTDTGDGEITRTLR